MATHCCRQHATCIVAWLLRLMLGNGNTSRSIGSNRYWPPTVTVRVTPHCSKGQFHVTVTVKLPGLSGCAWVHTSAATEPVGSESAQVRAPLLPSSPGPPRGLPLPRTIASRAPCCTACERLL